MHWPIFRQFNERRPKWRAWDRNFEVSLKGNPKKKHFRLRPRFGGSIIEVSDELKGRNIYFS